MEKPSQAAIRAVGKFEVPSNWLKTIENIRKVRQKYPAPVDSMGCDQANSRTDKDVNQRFQILQSLMLSSQTKDPITWAAVQKLKANGLGNPDGILAADAKDIEDLIYPVGFYKRKAVYLKETAKKIKEEYNGDIPDTLKDLCKLPGVGPKMAHLCMQEAWNVNSGIGVDTHVHRISARLGWVPKSDIKTPEDTRVALESWLPKEYWREINHLLVGFGQTICTPVGPKCNECYNSEICPSANQKYSKGVRKATTTIKSEPSSQEEKPIKLPAKRSNSSNSKSTSKKTKIHDLHELKPFELVGGQPERNDIEFAQSVRIKKEPPSPSSMPSEKDFEESMTTEQKVASADEVATIKTEPGTECKTRQRPSTRSQTRFETKIQGGSKIDLNNNNPTSSSRDLI